MGEALSQCTIDSLEDLTQPHHYPTSADYRQSKGHTTPAEQPPAEKALPNKRNAQRKNRRKKRNGIPVAIPTHSLPPALDPATVASNGKAWDLIQDQLQESQTATRTRRVKLNAKAENKKRKKKNNRQRRTNAVNTQLNALGPVAETPSVPLLERCKGLKSLRGLYTDCTHDSEDHVIVEEVEVESRSRIRIATLNVNGMKDDKLDAIAYYMTEMKLDILFLQDTRLDVFRSERTADDLKQRLYRQRRRPWIIIINAAGREKVLTTKGLADKCASSVTQ